MKQRTTITLEQYLECEDQQTGICRACGAIREGTEPDARKYRCDDCGEKQVFGPHEWLMEGRIT